MFNKLYAWIGKNSVVVILALLTLSSVIGIINLVIVLNETCKKYFICKGKIESWSEKHEFSAFEWLRH